MLIDVNIAILVLTCSVSFAYLFKTYVQRNRKLPPGPLGLPILGYLPFLRKDVHIKLTQLKEKYGDVYSLKLGHKYVVVLNSAEAIREAGHRPDLFGRPKQSDFTVVPFESPLVGNGKVWLEHRRFTFKVLKDLESSSAMEENIKHEINFFVDRVEKHSGNSFCPGQYVTMSVARYMGRLCFGVRYSEDGPEWKLLRRFLDEGFGLITYAAVSAYFPWLSRIRIIRKILKTERLVEMRADFSAFMAKTIKQHRDSFVEGAPRDFLDYYLSELDSKGKKQNTTFSESLINDTLIILLLGGINTVSETLEWCLCIMAAYPEVQGKVQKEIDDVVGRDRTPSFSDQKNLPYTQAVLMEIQRWRPIVHVNPKRTLADCSIQGFHLPKETLILVNSWVVHHDPRFWKNPDDFIPERFLSADGNTLLTDNKNFMPFGVGKRSCPGESIGIMELFLYFTVILQKFRLKFPDGHKPHLSGICGFTLVPKAQEVRFLRRDE